MPSVYLSPSTQQDNEGVGTYGTEKFRMNQLCDVVQKYLKLNFNFTIYRNRPEMSIYDVARDSNSKNPDIHVALHSNAGGGKGTEIWCSGSEKGTRLATMIYNNVAPLTVSSDRGVKVNTNYIEIGGVRAISCILEAMFHDNIVDVNDYLGKIEVIGKGIAIAIYQYFGMEFKEEKILYRVMCGSYHDRQNALEKANELRKAGFESVIMTFQE